MKVGLLGGSFNPPHNGHLMMARGAKEAHELDEVWLLVSPRPPHKGPGQLTDFEHRFEMARLTASELPFTSASDFEAGLTGTSYTYRTLEVLHERYPTHRFFFIMGADTVPELSTWKNPRRILELAAPVVVPRSGFSGSDVQRLGGVLAAEQLQTLRANYLAVEPVDISSTMIREKAARAEEFDSFLPAPVARYIRKYKLYSRCSA